MIYNDLFSCWIFQEYINNSALSLNNKQYETTINSLSFKKFTEDWGQIEDMHISYSWPS